MDAAGSVLLVPFVSTTVAMFEIPTDEMFVAFFAYKIDVIVDAHVFPLSIGVSKIL